MGKTEKEICAKALELERACLRTGEKVKSDWSAENEGENGFKCNRKVSRGESTRALEAVVMWI